MPHRWPQFFFLSVIDLGGAQPMQQPEIFMGFSESFQYHRNQPAVRQVQFIGLRLKPSNEGPLMEIAVIAIAVTFP